MPPRVRPGPAGRRDPRRGRPGRRAAPARVSPPEMSSPTARIESVIHKYLAIKFRVRAQNRIMARGEHLLMTETPAFGSTREALGVLRAVMGYLCTADQLPASAAARRAAGRAEPAAGCRVQQDHPARHPQRRHPAGPPLPLARRLRPAGGDLRGITSGTSRTAAPPASKTASCCAPTTTRS